MTLLHHKHRKWRSVKYLFEGCHVKTPTPPQPPRGFFMGMDCLESRPDPQGYFIEMGFMKILLPSSTLKLLSEIIIVFC